MARVSLIDEKSHPELSDLIARIRGARGRLIHIYGLMLHSPPLARAWLEFNSAAREATEVDGRSRELAILRVAVLNDVEYVRRAHAPRYALKEGLTVAQVEGLADWRSSGLFDAKQRALLAYVDAMTRDIDVPEAVFAELRGHFSERQIVEVTMLIGAYNMLTRVLKALKIDPEPPSGESG